MMSSPGLISCVGREARRETTSSWKKKRQSLLELVGCILEFPRPVMDIVMDYCSVVQWNLSVEYEGPLERLSDNSVRHIGLGGLRRAKILGDTPLTSGAHAWRVRLDGMLKYGRFASIGIVPEEDAGVEEGRDWEQQPFFGVDTGAPKRRWNGNLCGEWVDPLGQFERSTVLDILLDLEKRLLLVVVPKTGDFAPIALPHDVVAWRPAFRLLCPGNKVSVEVIEPEQVGHIQEETNNKDEKEEKKGRNQILLETCQFFPHLDL